MRTPAGATMSDSSDHEEEDYDEVYEDMLSPHQGDVNNSDSDTNQGPHFTEVERKHSHSGKRKALSPSGDETDRFDKVKKAAFRQAVKLVVKESVSSDNEKGVTHLYALSKGLLKSQSQASGSTPLLKDGSRKTGSATGSKPSGTASNTQPKGSHSAPTQPDPPIEVTGEASPPALKNRKIPAITGFFPDGFNHLAFARRLAGMLAFPPVLSRRGIDKRMINEIIKVYTRVSIQTTTEDDYHITTKFLTSEKIEFFVFKTLSDRTIKVVVRNLMECTPPEEIKSYLISKGFTIINVANMRNFRKVPLPMYLVELADADLTPEIYNLRTLLHMKVKVEAYRGVDGPRQCHNCCRFGHVASGCNALPWCVKCALQHPTSQCPKTDTSTPAKCANCQESHTASYRACRVYRAASKAYKARKSGNQPQTNHSAPKKPANVYIPAPLPIHNYWDIQRPNVGLEVASNSELVKIDNLIPIETNPNTPDTQEVQARAPERARARPLLHTRTNQRKINSHYNNKTTQAAKPVKKGKAVNKTVLQPAVNSTFSRIAELEADEQAITSPLANFDTTTLSKLIQEGLNLLQCRLTVNNKSDFINFQKATLAFLVEVLQLSV